jgi:hypothetical protein
MGECIVDYDCKSGCCHRVNKKDIESAIGDKKLTQDELNLLKTTVDRYYCSPPVKCREKKEQGILKRVDNQNRKRARVDNQKPERADSRKRERADSRERERVGSRKRKRLDDTKQELSDNQKKGQLIDYLSGPYSLTRHKKGKMDIYIIGEKHSRLNTCYADESIKKRLKINNSTVVATIDKYLHTLFDNSTKNIDILLEHAIFSPKSDPVSGVGDVVNMLHGNSSMWPNVKAHYADVRNLFYAKQVRGNSDIETPELTDILFKLQYIFTENMKKKSIKEKDSIVINVLHLNNKNSIINRIHNVVNLEEFINIVVSDLVKNSYLIKEISKSHISNPKLYKYITNLVSNTLHENKDNIPYYNFVVELIAILIKKPHLLIDSPRMQREVYTFMAKISASILDLYSISRIFNTFSDGSKPDNIIFLAGDTHASSIRKFLSDQNFELVEEIKGIKDSDDELILCLDMKGISQPFFS